MFRDFYTQAAELHEAIKQIRNVWIPLRREMTSIVKNGILYVYPAYTHYRVFDNGDIEYSIQIDLETYPRVLIHFEG